MGQVLVDSAAMTSWKGKMQSLNTDCVNDIDKINNLIIALNESFQGSYEEAFVDSFNEFTKIVRESHENMKDFSGFLEQIFEVLNTQ